MDWGHRATDLPLRQIEAAAASSWTYRHLPDICLCSNVIVFILTAERHGQCWNSGCRQSSAGIGCHGTMPRANSADIHHTGGRSSMHLEGPIRPIVSRITIHWPSFYNVVTGKTLALPNLIALQHIPLSPAGVIAKRPAPIALPNSCAA